MYRLARRADATLVLHSAQDEDEEDASSRAAPEVVREAEKARADVDIPRRKVKLSAKVERRIENWKLPDIHMLEDPPATRIRVDEREINRKAGILTDKLSQFAVKGEVVHAKPGREHLIVTFTYGVTHPTNTKTLESFSKTSSLPTGRGIQWQRHIFGIASFRTSPISISKIPPCRPRYSKS